MIRFRYTEDEKKCNLLRAEIYRRIAQGLPAAVVSDVLRNLSKIETMLHLEGLRQGLAISALTQLDAGVEQPAPLVAARGLKAHQAHASVYGSHDSPLVDAEEEWIKRIVGEGGAPNDPWLDMSPMRFGAFPIGTEPEQRVVERLTVAGPMPAALAPMTAENEIAPTLTEAQLEAFLSIPEAPPGTPTHQPAFLDRIRDALRAQVAQGKPSGWAKMVGDLHIALAEDAGAIDLVLATEEGRAVLDQCGLFDMYPDGMANMADFKTEGPLPTNDEVP